MTHNQRVICVTISILQTGYATPLSITQEWEVNQNC